MVMHIRPFGHSLLLDWVFPIPSRDLEQNDGEKHVDNYPFRCREDGPWLVIVAMQLQWLGQAPKTVLKGQTYQDDERWSM